MKKIFLLIAILAVALSSCVYADDEFAAAVKLYDEDYLMFVAGYGEGLYMLRDSGIYLLDCNIETGCAKRKNSGRNRLYILRRQSALFLKRKGKIMHNADNG